MARYDTLATTLQNTIYSNTNNDISGNTLRDQLIGFINTLGKGSNFMGILTDSNKPTAIPDGKQFYIGYNNSQTALSVNLAAVGLGTLSITNSNLYFVYCDDNGWAAVDIASGISTVITNVSNSIPTEVSDLSGSEYLRLIEGAAEDSGAIIIESLKSNTMYVFNECVSLDVQDYDYDLSDYTKALALAETHIFVSASETFDVTMPAGSLLRDGDDLRLLGGNTYLITVKGNLWKVELYA